MTRRSPLATLLFAAAALLLLALPLGAALTSHVPNGLGFAFAVCAVVGYCLMPRADPLD